MLGTFFFEQCGRALRELARPFYRAERRTLYSVGSATVIAAGRAFGRWRTTAAMASRSKRH
ncbi:hypothetical protein AU252_07460 [Pseudarthrobacter sulfonivorans]|uniref:Uncharacterized protein n=1 Tax=Pseudarthrobacter sulfonivorans TaxID=121292 RepID=A0A0U3P9U1_9MICC|nr:hypothetical protein AU252_07460 [Pseudarthrobacter sulfonivorans]